tara:strand:- start:2929 stop:3066 length:138 start_codon:yes stop_codon:yes gene_type:complete
MMLSNEVSSVLHGRDWKVNHKRMERLWKQEGLKVPQNSQYIGACD